MPIEDKTLVYGLPKPHPTNRASEDVLRIRAALDQVDGQLDRRAKEVILSRNSLLNTTTLIFDHTKILTKNSLIGTDSSKLDPNDPTKSQWVLAFGASSPVFYGREGAAVRLRLVSAMSAYPGYYEIPTKYALDQSASYYQCVIANTMATSTEIDERLAALALPLKQIGSWNACATTLTIPMVQVAGKHPYSSLFVRAFNLSVVSGAPAQAVNAFGGNSSLQVSAAEFFPTINYLDVI